MNKNIHQCDRKTETSALNTTVTTFQCRTFTTAEYFYIVVLVLLDKDCECFLHRLPAVILLQWGNKPSYRLAEPLMSLMGEVGRHSNTSS